MAGGPRERAIPQGDDRERLFCPDCGYVAYENPKLVVGSVVEHDSKILLCKRAIPPREGFWTLPAGYLELNETPEEGARREAWEEARAKLVLTGLLAVYTIERISQVQLLYRARLAEPSYSAGPESQEVQLFAWSEIPWSEIAFPTVTWALHRFRDVQNEPVLQPATNPPGASTRLLELER